MLPGLGTLLKAGVSGIRTLISNAKVGRDVLAAGASVTNTTSLGGTNTLVNAGTASGGPLAGVPLWALILAPVGLVLLIILLLRNK